MPYPVTMDIGQTGGSVIGREAPNYTYVGYYNTCNQKGVIDIFYVTISVYGGVYDCELGVCSGAGGVTRSKTTVGSLDAGAQTISGLALDAEEGDYVQGYCKGPTYGAFTSATGTGTNQYGSVLGNKMDGSSNTYTPSGSNLWLNLYATGVTDNAALDAVVMAGTGAGVVPAVSAEIAASVTAVIAEATSLFIAPDYNATVTDYPTIPDIAAALFPPSIRIQVFAQIPLMTCGMVMTKHGGFGSVTITAACMAATAAYLAMNPVNVAYHSVYTGNYFTRSMRPNRVYVITKDNLDNTLYGEAIDSTKITEYGEMLQPVVTSVIPSSALANSIAAVILSKLRMTAELGEISVPPNCGMESGDVIQIRDIYGNQTAANYRVIGFNLIYDPTGSVTQFKHTIRLTEV